MYRRQWLTTLNFLLGIFLFGMAYGHSTVLTDQLTTRDSAEHAGGDELFGRARVIVDDLVARCWIVSVMILCASPGCWILAGCDRLLGRREILSLSALLFLVGWTTVAFAGSPAHIVLGRALLGFTASVFTGLVALYQGECSIPSLRATLMSTHGISFAVGMATSHALAVWLHWRAVASAAGVVSLLTFLSVLHMPESPVWLLRNGRFEEALRSWTFLRGIRDLEELRSMRDPPGPQNGKPGGPEGTWACGCWSPAFWKPLAAMLLYFSVLQVSGTAAVANYCGQMVRVVAGPGSVHAGTLTLDACRLGCAVLLSLATGRYGSRALTLSSAVASALCLLLAGATMRLGLGGPWLPLALLFGYQTVVMGIITLPWTFCSELFPAGRKETAMGLVTSYNFLLSFGVVHGSPQLMEALGAADVFLLYGSLTLAGSLALYLVLPDTRNKSLREIELMFLGE